MNHETDIYHPSNLAEEIAGFIKVLETKTLDTLEGHKEILRVLGAVVPTLTGYGKVENSAAQDIQAHVEENLPISEIHILVLLRLTRLVRENGWPMSERGKTELTY